MGHWPTDDDMGTIGSPMLVTPGARIAGARPAAAPLSRAWARPAALILVLLGTALRVAPLVEGRDVLLRQPTEDGYLMLTVARNVAIGRGMSTADGTIPTNGVQPLATALFSGCFVLAGGDKTAGVALAMALSVAISGLAFLAVFRLGRALCAGRADGDTLALLAAALWFVSPNVLPHSMNALETGLYLAVVAQVMHLFIVHAADPDRDLSGRGAATLGVWLGIAFWARNDAVFLAAAVGLTRLGLSWGRPAAVLGRRVRELGLTAAVMAAVAAPWMLFNLIRFGSVVPMSAKAEAATRLGENLGGLPAKLAEYITVMVAIPNAMESRAPVQLACVGLVVTASIVAAALFRRGSTPVRAGVLLGATLGALMSIYYGVFFGAPHFLARFTAPISILCAFLTVGIVLDLVRPRALGLAALGGLVLVGLAVDARNYVKRREHMHFQVVDWVQAHVPAESWVGAIQSGTLGFFHDRTINLDGKTNVAALLASRAHRSREYILASPIVYLADWTGIAGWASWLRPEFALVVDDASLNLGVLERVAAANP